MREVGDEVAMRGGDVQDVARLDDELRGGQHDVPCTFERDRDDCARVAELPQRATPEAGGKLDAVDTGVGAEVQFGLGPERTSVRWSSLAVCAVGQTMWTPRLARASARAGPRMTATAKGARSSRRAASATTALNASSREVVAIASQPASAAASTARSSGEPCVAQEASVAGRRAKRSPSPSSMRT